MGALNRQVTVNPLQSLEVAELVSVLLQALADEPTARIKAADPCHARR